MAPPTTLPPPPPAMRRAAPSRRTERAPEPPCTYPAIFREFTEAQRPAVQIAIDALVAARRSVTVLRVREHMAGILPASDRAPSVLPQRQPQIVETVQVVAAPDFDEAARMAKTAEQMTPRRSDWIRQSDFRARVKWAESLIAEGADRIEPSRPNLTIDGWGYSPAANRYESEDTWRFRLAELFAPLQATECGG